MDAQAAFELLGKVSAVKEPDELPGQEEHEELISVVDDLTEALELSTYPAKSEIKTELNETLELFDLVRRYPFLATRTTVAVYYGGNMTGEMLLPNIIGKFGWNRASAGEEVTSILHHEPDSGSVLATNHAGVPVPLSQDEYDELLDLPSVGIRPGDVIRSCAIGASLPYQNMNFALFQSRQDTKQAHEANLVELCTTSILFYDDIIDGAENPDDPELPQWIKARLGPDREQVVYVACGRNDAHSCKSVVRLLNRRYPEVVFKMRSLDDMANELTQYDGYSDNCMFSLRLTSAALDLERVEHLNAEEYQERAGILARDSIMLDANQDLTEMREETLDAAANAQDRAQRVSAIREQLSVSMQNLKRAVLHAAEQSTDVAYPNAALLRGRYGAVLGQCILYALDADELAAAGQYLQLMQAAGHPDAFLYELRSQYAAGDELDEQGLMELARRSHPSLHPSDILLESRMYFADELNLSESDIGAIGAERKGERSADELFYLGLSAEQEGDLPSAIRMYWDAWAAGSSEGGTAVLQHLAEHKKKVKAALGMRKGEVLRTLADEGHPEAASRYAEFLWQHDEDEQGAEKYENLAIAWGYEPAIQDKADELYEDVVYNYLSDESPDLEDIEEALRLYQYLLDEDENSENLHNLAVLQFITGDYSVSKEDLKQGDVGLYLLGKMYWEGLGVAKDEDLAVEYLTESSLTDAVSLLATIQLSQLSQMLEEYNEDDESSMIEDIEGYCDRFLELCNESIDTYYPISDDLQRGLGIPWDEEVFLSFDDSLFQNGKVGFAITERGFYVRHAFHNAEFLPYEAARGRSVTFDGFYRLMVGGFKAASLATFSTDDQNLLYSVYDAIVERLDE